MSVKVEISKSAINKIVSKLKAVKINQDRINYLFFRYSLNWVKNRANTLLDQRTNGYYSSMAREWDIIIYNNVAKLENKDPNSGAIEFGVGIIGKYLKDPQSRNAPHVPAQENGYQYNVDSPYKDKDGYWTYYLPNMDMYIRTRGYGGKSFLYDSIVEYIQTEKYKMFYEQAFNKVMKGIAVK